VPKSNQSTAIFDEFLSIFRPCRALARLTSPNAAMDLDQLRDTFLSRLTTAADLDDPLALHQEYIESLKSIPSASNPQLLLEALERTTQAFIEDRRYTNDPRYLRAWLDYASRCREPEDVFAFLGMRGVCQDLAAYYEEYAGYLERRKLEQAEVYSFRMIYF